jgi:hypothetical protein
MAYSKTVSVSDLAVILGITERWACQLVTRKVITRVDGGFDLVDSVQSFVAYREKSAAGERGGSYAEARATLYQERARMARLQREELEGSLLQKDHVRSMNTDIMAVVRTRLLATPTSLAPRLLELHRPQEAETIVRNGIVDALTELAALGEVAEQARSRRRKNGGGG